MPYVLQYKLNVILLDIILKMLTFLLVARASILFSMYISTEQFLAIVTVYSIQFMLKNILTLF